MDIGRSVRLHPVSVRTRVVVLLNAPFPMAHPLQFMSQYPEASQPGSGMTGVQMMLPVYFDLSTWPKSIVPAPPRTRETVKTGAKHEI